MPKTRQVLAQQSNGAVAVEIAADAPNWTYWLVRVSDALDNLTEALYVLFTVAFASIMLVGVFFRYVLNDSLSWSDELAVTVFIWATFLGISTCYLHNKHVNIDFLIRSLPPLWRDRMAVLAEGLSCAYIVVLLISSTEAMDIASRTRPGALQWPLSVTYVAIPLASAIMLVHWARRNLASSAWQTVFAKLTIAAALLALFLLPIGQYIPLTGMSRFCALAVMFVLPLLIGVPVAFSLGLLATLYISILGNIPLSTGAMQIFFGISAITFLAVPLLVLSGSLMHEIGIARYIVDFAQVLVGRLRGGLAASNVVASFLFGDISGSAVSDTAAIGSLMIPEMKQRGYKADFCAALQGAAGTLGMTAPLSITLILFASAINASVSRLAAATILPGLLVASSFMLVAFVHSRRNGYPSEHVPRELIVPRVLRAVPGLFSLVLLLGGILGGVFTPAEVGTVLVAYILLLSFFLYRVAKPRLLYNTVIKASHTSSMVLFMSATSSFLGFVLARDLVSMTVVDTIGQITTNKLAVIFLMSFVFVILGMVLEAPAMIFGFMPTFMPLLTFVGVDPIHWGVLFVINMGLGMIVPPVALNLFVSTSLAGTSYEQAVRASIPFISIMIVDMILVAVFPHIPLMIPHILFDYPIR